LSVLFVGAVLLVAYWLMQGHLERTLPAAEAGDALARLAGEFALALVGTALVACALAMAAVLAQVDSAPQTRASVEQERLSMNAPPSTLMDELDRVMQSSWTERIPNRRYARIEPVTTAATPAGNFAGELFEETQPLPVSGTKAPTVTAALATPRHRALLLLDLYATVLVLASIGMTLLFVRDFDVGAPWQQNRFSLVGTAAILALVATFCFQASARLWGRFNFESILTWVEMVGSWQTSRIGTGNNFSSRMNTENNVVRTEAMTLRVWRARIESVVFGKDDARQVTAMFSTEQEARALAEQLMQFARSQSVLVAPFSGEDEKRIAALNAGERAMDSGAPHQFGFTPAVSLFVECDEEDELDHAYAALAEGGQVLMPLQAYPFSPKFAWVNDRFGVSWQLNLA
jgi:predicted 3-demethylubiquinone-9 3-methyltransferase (glyoxalase superfamily)